MKRKEIQLNLNFFNIAINRIAEAEKAVINNVS